MNGWLIPYAHLPYHVDPLFEEFTYGDVDRRAGIMKRKFRRGDCVFFHIGREGRKYITAYYVVDRVLYTVEAAKDKSIVAKYKNPHLTEFFEFGDPDRPDAILFGDPSISRVLEKPLLFDRTLTEKLSLNIKFHKGKTETQAIGSATRAWRKLTEEDIQVILAEAISSREKDKLSLGILSTGEVRELIEKDIERFVAENSGLIGKSIKSKGRQLDTSVGRIDLLFEDKTGNLIVVELKLGRIGREAIGQLKRYMEWAKQGNKKEVTGVIVCEGVMPAFEDDFKKLKDIKIFCYGWQLAVKPWS